MASHDETKQSNLKGISTIYRKHAIPSTPEAMFLQMQAHLIHMSESCRFL